MERDKNTNKILRQENLEPIERSTQSLSALSNNSWFQSNTIDLRASDPSIVLDEKEQAALGKIVGGARVVALGEITHGSSEIFSLKHRLIRHLVDHCGFRTIVFEANALCAQDVDRFIVTGEGDPRSVLSGLGFWTWDVQEVLDLLLWLREFNSKEPNSENRVRFFGIDAQTTGYTTAALKDVLARSAVVHPAIQPAAASLITLLEALPSDQDIQKALDTNEKERAAQSYSAVATEIRSLLPEYLSAGEWREVEGHLQMLEDNVAITSATNQRIRDGIMARRTLAIERERGNTGVIVWAHNWHIMKVPAHQFEPMGEQLAINLGQTYRVIGITIHSGEYLAKHRERTIGVHKIVDPGSDTLENFLSVHRPGTDRANPLLVDLRERDTVPWPPKLRMNALGCLYESDYDTTYWEFDPLNRYDALILVEKSSASKQITSPS